MPHYNWHWQNWYTLDQPIVLPKGTKIECTAHFDNSANNPDNADPNREVPWGEQSWDEMMVGFFNLVFDAELPVQKFVRRQEGKGGNRQPLTVCHSPADESPLAVILIINP